MKRARIIKGADLKTAPFVPEDFIQNEAKKNTIEKRKRGVSKKMLKALADELKLPYDDEKISFSKKLITHYLNKSKKQ